MQFPAAAPISHRLRVSTRPSLQNSAHSGRHGGNLPISRGRGRQAMHLPCKQAYVGALPTDSTISLRGTRLKHRERSHKPFEVGVVPAPATHFREVIRLPDCKSGVRKQSRKRRTGALPALPTIYGSVAQSAERPVVCGRVEGATPFGSANLVREPVSRNAVLRLHKKQDPGGFPTKRRGDSA